MDNPSMSLLRSDLLSSSSPLPEGAEIELVIRKLVQGSPPIQQRALETYFTPSAEFNHPFCRTGSSSDSRWYILSIYRWYKIMSPKVEISIKSIAFDEPNKLLYVSMHQDFKIWVIPFYSASVDLTTVLTLTNDPRPTSNEDSKKTAAKKECQKTEREKQPLKWYIKKQDDLYQTSEFIRFVVPFGGATLLMLWQLIATYVCVLCACLGYPVTLWMWNESCSKELMDGTSVAQDSAASSAIGGAGWRENHQAFAAEVGHNH